MGTQSDNIPRGTPEGTLARILVVLLLLVLALPVFYLGLLTLIAFLRSVQTDPSWPILWTVIPLLVVFLVVLNALGTLLSFRHALITVATLVLFYLGWTLSIYPFPGILPFPFYWVQVPMSAILGFNLLWTISSRIP